MKVWMQIFFGIAVVLSAVGTAVIADSEGDYIVYVGSYTDAPSTAKGIYAWRFSTRTGDVAPLGLVAETVNPAYVSATPDGRFLYAVNWRTETATTKDTVSAYAIDLKTGALKLLNRASSGGGLPNQVIVDPRGNVAAVTNYGFNFDSPDKNNSAFAVLPVHSDGKLSDPFYVDHYTGPALSSRQKTGAHTHGVTFTKNGRYAFVAELGLDRVHSYQVDGAKPAVTPSDPPYVTVTPGAGPRRLVLSPDDRFLYVNHQDNSTVSVFSVQAGKLTEIQNVSTLPEGFAGRNSTAETQIDKTGRFLYVSNRGADTIAVYAIDPQKGNLTVREFVPALGKTPRNITIDPTGQYLFSANQGSDNVVIFKLDSKTGHLTPTGKELKMGQPGSIFFVKAAARPR